MRGLKSFNYWVVSRIAQSHLTQVRGLKLKRTKALVDGVMSHLTQVRGLKFQTAYKDINKQTSHLTQVRGLKYVKLLYH